jgi:integrase/recombinase XerD
VALANFRRFIGSSEMCEVGRDDLEAYSRSLRGKLTPQTAYLYVEAVKAFFQFLAQSHEILVNPAANLALPKLDKPRLVGPTLCKEETERLLAVPDVKTPLGLRDRALLEFLYATALRVSEIARVKLSDLVLAGKEVSVFVREGKGARDRMIPLGKVASRWLNRYLKTSRPILARFRLDVDGLFVTWRSRSIRSYLMGRIVLGLGQKAKLSIPLTCHVIRRTVATQMLRNGAPPVIVARLLDHHDLRSLARYVASAASETKRIHRNFHPREADHE